MAAMPELGLRMTGAASDLAGVQRLAAAAPELVSRPWRVLTDGAVTFLCAGGLEAAAAAAGVELARAEAGHVRAAAHLLEVAATNDIPEQSELEALADRFVLKIESRPIKDHAFDALVAAGMRNEALRAVGARPWADGPASLQDLLKFKRYMDLSFADEGGSRERWCPPAVFAELRRVVRVLESEDKVYVSDRKVVKLYKLVRIRAFLMHGGPVEHDDLRLLRYVGNKRHELGLVEDKVDRMLGLR